MTVQFLATHDEIDVILKIAQRADKEIFRPARSDQDITDTMMDIEACHSNGCPLKLEQLLAADDFNFAHDVVGIRRHIDRTTGKMQDCFLPRFANLEG